jgi:hypothetical protein
VVILEFWIGNFGIFGIFLSEVENGRPFSTSRKLKSPENGCLQSIDV